MGIEIARSFGSTEHPSITGCTPEAPHEKRVNTDGRPLPGVEIRLVDDDGQDVEVGMPGEIWSRGPEMFTGYTDAAATTAAFSPDGWFMTGDIGVLDDDGYLAITDRKKDIIIRGGENVSAQEVEELLVRMPDVAEVAVVAAPDARLGEVACAFFRMQPGSRGPRSRRGANVSRAIRGSRARSGPSTCGRSRSSRARRAGRSRSSCSANSCVTASPAPDVSGLLDGMRVLDAGIWRPVPHATQMLADLGAEVLKIEPPGGDPMRTFPHLFRDVAGHKRSIELNLRSEEGRAKALGLAAGADVFCEGWRPGVAARLGVDYEAVRAVNPSIIYCSVSGYGQTGPNVARPGHDVNYQALAGALAPRPGEQPAIPRVPIADLAAGTVAALCICAAWARRIQTGEGERIDVAMADVVASWSGTSSGNLLRGRSEPARGSAGYGIFVCADGGFITLAVISEDHFWHAVCDALDLGAELRGLGHLARLDRFDECQAAVAAACRAPDVRRRARPAHAGRRARRAGPRPGRDDRGRTVSLPRGRVRRGRRHRAARLPRPPGAPSAPTTRRDPRRRRRWRGLGLGGTRAREVTQVAVRKAVAAHRRSPGLPATRAAPAPRRDAHAHDRRSHRNRGTLVLPHQEPQADREVGALIATARAARRRAGVARASSETSAMSAATIVMHVTACPAVK